VRQAATLNTTPGLPLRGSCAEDAARAGHPATERLRDRGICRGAECPLADGGLQGQPVSGTLVDSPMLEGGSMLVSGVHCGNLYQIGYSGTT